MNLPQKGKLYLIPSYLAEKTFDKSVVPLTKQVIEELDFFIVENIKTARRYIKSVYKDKDIDSTQFEIINKKSTEDEVMDVVLPIINGQSAGVISEAGAPGIADPGAMVVEFCHQNNIEVIPLVGPSSIFMALMASGMNGQGFTFHGYLPIDKSERKRKIQELETTMNKTGFSQIFMETPYRNLQLLEDVVKTCKPYTKLCIASNITAPDEWIKTKPIQQWKGKKVDIHKKPTIFVIGK